MTLHEHPDPGLRLLLVRHEPALEHPRTGDLTAAFWRLYWARTPGARLRFEGGRLPLNRDQLVLVPPDCSLRMECSGPVDLLYVHFTLRPGWVWAEPPKPRRLPAPPSARRALLSVIRQLHGGTDLASSSLRLSAFLSETLSTLRWKTMGPAGFDDGRMARALLIMARHGTETGFTVTRWARLSGMGTATLHRLFRFHIATSPKKHLLSFRLSRVETLLLDETSPIEAVAVSCGFADRYHMTRHFRARHGMGPSTWRKLRWQLKHK